MTLKEVPRASLERRNQKFRIVFMYEGRKYGYSLKTNSQQDAEALAGGVEKVLMRIEQKLLAVPPGIDIISFVRNDGQVEQKTEPQPERLTFAKLRDAYIEAHALGAMEENSLATVKMHLRHFVNTLGERFQLQDLAFDDLQGHIATRSQKKYRDNKLSPVTLRKEMASFGAM